MALWVLVSAGAGVAQAQPVVQSVEATAVDEVVVTFDVDIDPVTGQTVANYRIREKARPTFLVNIGSISVTANVATLSLSGTLRDVVYEILVSNIQVQGGGPGSGLSITEFPGPAGDFAPPTVVGATTNDGASLLVLFNEALDEATAEDVANYVVFPTADPQDTAVISSATLSGTNVTLTFAQTILPNVGHTVQVTGVQDLAGNVIAAQNQATFTWTVNIITPIADIHDRIDEFRGRTVTVRGQVYIPTLSRSATTVSGYVQDDSGRGLNIFGQGAEGAVMQDRTAIVEITGTVDLFFTTVEILNVSAVREISTGNPRLVPTFLTTGAAASPRWEGTYIQVSGQITSQSETGGAVNYVVNDGSGPLTVRVDLDLSTPRFQTGQTITGAGAGSQFQSTFQIIAGNGDDVVLGAQFGFVLAFQSAPNQATLVFTAPLDLDSVRELENYTVTNQAGISATVTGADLSPDSSARVVLTLAEPFDTRERWKVTVIGISDTEGGTIARPQSQIIAGGPVFEANLEGPARTFLPREEERYPITLTVPQELTGSGGEIMLRIFDLTGRLQRTLFDSRFESRVFDLNSQLTLEWDGLDEFSQRLPAGAYVAHLLVVDKDTGNRQQVQMPVVVASRLER